MIFPSLIEKMLISKQTLITSVDINIWKYF